MSICWISRQSPSVDDMEYGTNLVPVEDLPMPTRTTWMGYRNAEGPQAPETFWES